MNSAKSKIIEGKEAQQRILLLMNYSVDKTLSENKNLQKNKLFEQGQAKGIEQKLGVTKNPWVANAEYEAEEEEEEKQKEARYREGCGPMGQYYENAVEPPRTPAGDEGVLACCCYYPIPGIGEGNQGEIQGMYIPRTSTLEFFDIKDLSDFVDGWINKWAEEGITDINKDWMIENVTKIFPVGTVKKITQADGTVYITWIKRSARTTNGGFEHFYFMGYYTEGGKAFEMEYIKDDRNLAMKLVDDWGTILQWTVVILTALGGLLCEGCTLPLAWELGIEFGLGLANGIREIQKGQDVAGYFSVLIGMLPGLKYAKGFRGINPKYFDELAEAFQKSGLNSASKPSQYVAFYNKLRKPTKEILDRLIRGGDTRGQRELIKQLSKEAAEKLPNLLSKGFNQMWKQNPKLFKEIPFFERFWVRELGTGLAVGVASTVVQHICPECSKATSDKLTAEMKDELDGIYELVPEEIQKEITYQILNNPAQAKEIYNSQEFQEAKENTKTLMGDYEGNVSKGIINLWGAALSETAKKQGLDWTPTSDIFDGRKMPEDELKKLLNQGWIRRDSLDIGQEYTKLDKINDVYYVLPKKDTIGPKKQ